MQRMTYSAFNAARNCQKKYELRYREHLCPREKAESLAFGSVIHRALELWHGRADDGNRLLAVLDLIDAAYPNRVGDPSKKQSWHLAKAMMVGYAARYPEEPFEVVAIEKEFEAPIVNPETGAESRTFRMAGKVDGIIRMEDGLYLLEHKTAGALTRDYLERLWTDTQIAAYAHYLRETGYPIVGVIYNVLLKTRLRQNTGETEEEYQARKTTLAAKNKSGKSTAQRQEPESDEEFRGRLADWYSKPDVFHRERIYLSQDRLDMLREEIWQGCQMLLEANRRGKWLLNTSHCHSWGRPCEYYPYCASGFNSVVLDNLYEIAPPHEELAARDELAF